MKGSVKLDSQAEWSYGALVLFIAIVVVAGVLAFNFWPKGEARTYTGTVDVTIHNDALFDRVAYTLYIDGISVKADTVAPLGTVSLSFPVYWTSTHSMHTFALKIVTSTHTQDFSVDVKDKAVGSVPITI